MKSNTSIQLAAFAATLMVGCQGEAPRSSSATQVGDAYRAIVVAVADCGKKVSECARAAGDDVAAQAECEALAAECAAAGGEGADELSEAARVCEEQMSACVAATGDGATCSAELRACLGVGTGGAEAGGPPAGKRGGGKPEGAPEDGDEDEEDGAGGPPEGSRGAAVRDCRATLEPCIAAGTAAELCAEEVRTCVAALLPDPDEMTDEEEQPGRGGPRGAGELPERAASARACVDAFHACANGAEPAPDACVAEIEACMAARGEEEEEEVEAEE